MTACEHCGEEIILFGKTWVHTNKRGHRDFGREYCFLTLALKAEPKKPIMKYDTEELTSFVESKPALHPLFTYISTNWGTLISGSERFRAAVRAIRDNWPKEPQWYPCDEKHIPELNRMVLVENRMVLMKFKAGKVEWSGDDKRWLYLPDDKPEPTEAEKAWEEYKATRMFPNESAEDAAFSALTWMWQKAKAK